MKLKIWLWVIYCVLSFAMFIVFCLYGEQIANFVRQCAGNVWKCWCGFISWCATVPDIVKGWFIR